jgi:cytochrome c oxidase subunit 2
MNSLFELLPEQASTAAASMDRLYLFIWFVSVFFVLLTAALVVFFAVRYRRRSESQVTTPPHLSSKLELAASGVLFVLVMVMFAWGSVVFYQFNTPPDDAMEVLVVGKQWMWKLQQPQGKREINELHVPVGQPVKLTMTSEDVIHSFFIPAFRVKNDVVPGRYTSVWFEPTKPGDYHMFCAQYCGTEHSMMVGWVHVLTPADYEKWLRGEAGPAESPAAAGAKLFTKLGCATCHNPEMSTALGPKLDALVGHKVELADGTTLVADEAYLRESILNSQAKIVKGYQPLMPLFKGMITEDQLMQLIAYIKSLSKTEGTGNQNE